MERLSFSRWSAILRAFRERADGPAGYDDLVCFMFAHRSLPVGSRCIHSLIGDYGYQFCELVIIRIASRCRSVS